MRQERQRPAHRLADHALHQGRRDVQTDGLGDSRIASANRSNPGWAMNAVLAIVRRCDPATARCRRALPRRSAPKIDAQGDDARHAGGA